MGAVVPKKPNFIEQAIELATKGDFNEAKEHLDFPLKAIGDGDYLQFLMELDQGVKQFIRGNHSEANGHFKTILPLLELSEDPELKFVLYSIARFSEGMEKLIKGDAHGAIDHLEISSEAFKKLSYLFPAFVKDAHAAKAITLITIGRSHFHGGDLANTHLYFGKADAEHAELLKLLEQGNKNDSGYFSNIYASNIEKAMLFGFMELQAFEVQALRQRLNSVKQDVKGLLVVAKELDQPPLTNLFQAYVNTINIYEELANIEEEVFFKRQPLSGRSLKKMDSTFSLLIQNTDLIHKSGERGRGLQQINEQLKKIHIGLLEIGKVRVNDFGKFGGLISSLLFLVTVVGIQIFIKPIGFMGLVYTLGAMVISLIGGFGFGALKFIPLLKLYANAIKLTKPKK
jgi:hypothetical protein